MYHCDSVEPRHVARLNRACHPAMHRWVEMTLDERWTFRSPDAIAEHTIAFGAERFEMVLDDLLAIPQMPPVLVEGTWLFPDLVAPLLSSPRQALWLFPTTSFKLESATRRGKPSSQSKASDPERMVRKWFDRDMILAAYTCQLVMERGLSLIEIDGSQSPDELATMIESHFAPLFQAK